MSIRLSTKYTVVPRAAASWSIGVSGWTKCETSAMSTRQIRYGSEHGSGADVRTPASMFPFARRRACRASSISWHPVSKYVNERRGSIGGGCPQRTGGIDATYDQVAQVFPVPPVWIGSAFRGHNPIVALCR